MFVLVIVVVVVVVRGSGWYTRARMRPLLLLPVVVVAMFTLFSSTGASPPTPNDATSSPPLEPGANFKRWCTAIPGCSFGKLDWPVRDGNGVVGMVASEDIEEGELILSFPHSMTISTMEARVALEPLVVDGGLLLRDESHEAAQIVLAAYLCLERDRGPDSRFAIYIQDVLPREVGLLHSWSLSELRELQDADLVRSATLEEYDRRRGYYARLLTAFPTLFREGNAGDREKFDWAMDIVYSRSFGYGRWEDDGTSALVTNLTSSSSRDELLLVPLADLVNHDPWNTVEGMTLLQTTEEETNLTVWRYVAHKEIRRGEQVFGSYGEDDNARLLISYGFAVEGNPYDMFEIAPREEGDPTLRLAPNHAGISILLNTLIYYFWKPTGGDEGRGAERRVHRWIRSAERCVMRMHEELSRFPTTLEEDYLELLKLNIKMEEESENYTLADVRKTFALRYRSSKKRAFARAEKVCQLALEAGKGSGGGGVSPFFPLTKMRLSVLRECFATGECL